MAYLHGQQLFKVMSDISRYLEELKSLLGPMSELGRQMEITSFYLENCARYQSDYDLCRSNGRLFKKMMEFQVQIIRISS